MIIVTFLVAQAIVPPGVLHQGPSWKVYREDNGCVLSTTDASGSSISFYGEPSWSEYGLVLSNSSWASLKPAQRYYLTWSFLSPPKVRIAATAKRKDVLAMRLPERLVQEAFERGNWVAVEYNERQIAKFQAFDPQGFELFARCTGSADPFK